MTDSERTAFITHVVRGIAPVMRDYFGDALRASEDAVNRRIDRIEAANAELRAELTRRVDHLKSETTPKDQIWMLQRDLEDARAEFTKRTAQLETANARLEEANARVMEVMKTGTISPIKDELLEELRK
jgi:chromosome segregation ATPase